MTDSERRNNIIIRPNTPVLSNVIMTDCPFGIDKVAKRNESDVGANTLTRQFEKKVGWNKHMLYAALNRTRVYDKTELLVRLGGPGSGKTTLMSEELSLVSYNLDIHKQSKDEIGSHICHVSFEEAQWAAVELGLIDSEQPPGTFTPDQYSLIFEPIFANAISNAIDVGYKLIFVETPGMAGRGNNVINNLANKKKPFNKVDCSLTFQAYTHDKGLRLHTQALRGQYETKDKKDVLTFSGTRVVGAADTSHIGGGGLRAITAYYDDEIAYLDEYARINGIKKPDFTTLGNVFKYIDEVEKRAKYLENIHYPHYFKSILKVPQRRVLIGRVPWIGERVLYQDKLDEYNFILNLFLKDKLDVLMKDIPL